MQDLTDFFNQHAHDIFNLVIDKDSIYLRAEDGDNWLTLSEESVRALAKDISWFMSQPENATDCEKTLA